MHNRAIAAKSASSIFYEEYNDVDIYIEDTGEGYRKIFKELLNKALGKKFNIEQVFPLGNRSQVIDQCKKNQESDGRKKVYIVDGDLHILNYETDDELKGLYVLPRYCIENYLFCENAINETADEEECEMDEDEIRSKIDFEYWLSENEQTLVDLFIIYAICHRYIPDEQTVGYKVSKLCSSNSGIVNPDKVMERKESLLSKLIPILGEEKLQQEINSIKERINRDDRKLLKFVSGKDYLFPLIITRLQSIMRFPSNSISVRLRLAKKANADELKNLENYIFE
ncbi:DUF4435 domain-containing protein [Sphingobacterium corticis]|uniref:DUF4435 domain-containing protein n=1 Tax=Sphingobacterium corticis TaxID=1812823 RepID=A0ABW5NIU4_9SPHI